MKVLETVAVGITGLAIGVFVGMCAPETRKPKFCKDITTDIGKRLKAAEEKLSSKLKKGAENKKELFL